VDSDCVLLTLQHNPAMLCTGVHHSAGNGLSNRLLRNREFWGQCNRGRARHRFELHTSVCYARFFVADEIVFADEHSRTGNVRRPAQRGVTNLSDKNLRHTAPSKGAWREQAVNARGGRVVMPMTRGPSGMPRAAAGIRKASDLTTGFSSEGDSSAARASGNNAPGGDRKVATAVRTSNKVGLLGRLTGWVRRMFS
jgi:hypothetical protein